jgi:hypothetical protein
VYATETEAETTEYQAVRCSRFFAGSTNSRRFLEFVCEKYFAGVHHVSEQEIAIGALGRRSDFDPIQDSIVRVEAHRVRKRLRDYYEVDGADHAARLTIPQGSYMPQFVLVIPERCVEANLPKDEEFVDNQSASNTVPSGHHEVVQATTGSHRKSLLPLIVFSSTAAILAAVAVASYVHWSRVKTDPRPAGSPSVDLPQSYAPSSEVLIMAGSSAKSYTDQLGHIWSADRFYRGGEPWTVSYRRIARTEDPQLFLTARQGEDFSYDIPLQNGLYELRLYFAETFFGEGNREGGGEASRIFDVMANGIPILSEFDPLSDAAGSNTADVRIFTGLSPAEDGKLHLEFRSRWQLKSIAFVNAIEIIRTGTRSMAPVRWVAARSAVEDTEGNLWVPDEFVEGGRRRELGDVVTATKDPELYKSERYGNFSYAIPVALDNTYTLTLHFSEHWWGIPDFGGPPSSAEGKRAFDVFCNGAQLLQNYDIFKEAGSSSRAVSVTFHGVKPNHQGKIQLSFVPARHYASLDALEIRPERFE